MSSDDPDNNKTGITQLQALPATIAMSELHPNGAKVYMGYRDRAYIRKDIILKLVQYGSLNQTMLLSLCGLNLQKHREILDELEDKGLIQKTLEHWGSKTVTKYSPTEKGKEFCKKILEPYETMFPRKRGRSKP